MLFRVEISETNSQDAGALILQPLNARTANRSRTWTAARPVLRSWRQRALNINDRAAGNRAVDMPSSLLISFIWRGPSPHQCELRSVHRVVLTFCVLQIENP